MSTPTAYQRVGNVAVTPSDYDADPTKFPYYLSFDGVSDWLQTASIDFSTVTSDGLPRRNLLSFPTAFDNGVWSRVGTAPTVTVDAVLAPDGTATADRLAFSASGIANRLVQALGASTGAVPIQLSVYLRGDVGGEVMLVSDGWTISSDFTLTTSWQRFTFSTTGNVASTGLLLYAKTGTPTVYAWGAQLETGSTATAFQNIGTDKMSVFAGVRRQGVKDGSATFRIVELSTSSANNGIFTMAGPDGASDIVLGSRGTGIVVSNVTSGYGSPSTEVLTGLADISADVASLRHNGAQIATSAADQGTGNYGNYPLYIGRRGGTSQPFNGRIYSLLVLGRTATAAEIASAETYVAAKTGVVLA